MCISVITNQNSKVRFLFRVVCIKPRKGYNPPSSTLCVIHMCLHAKIKSQPQFYKKTNKLNKIQEVRGSGFYGSQNMYNEVIMR